MPEQGRNRTHRFSRLCSGALLWIACICCGGLLLLNVLYRVEVSHTDGELVTILPSALRGIGMLSVTAVLIFAAGFLPRDKKPRERTCFLALCAVYTVMALYLMLNTDSALRHDSMQVYSAGKGFLEGDYQAFAKGGYMSYCPHQAGLMLYDALVYCFGKNPLTAVIANFCFVLGIQYLIWRIADTLFHSSAVNLVTMGLSFAFLPQFFFILFIYGTIPGFFFMMLAFYQTLRFSQGDGLGHLLAGALSGGAAVMLRKNYIIAMAALAIYLLLRGLEEKKKGKWLAAVCAVILCAVVPNQLLLAGLEAKTGSDLHQGMPGILYIGMGTDIDNCSRGPGWWDGSNTRVFCVEADYDPQIAGELGRQRLADNLQKILSEPRRAIRFFWDKVASTWCDPLYQSTWSGPLERQNQYTYTELLRSIYTGGTASSVLGAFCKWVSLTLWASALLFLLAFRKTTAGWKLCYLYTIGGALFHLFWETKSQYVYPYVFCLIPFSAFALVEAARWWARRRASKKQPPACL